METLTGWHGRYDDRHPTDVRDLYLAPNRDYADDWAATTDSTGRVYRVTVEVTNPLHIRDPYAYEAMWMATAVDDHADAPNFHPAMTSVVTAWLRAQGYDALVLHESMFDVPDDRHDLWELTHSGFGDPQTIILNPATAKAVQVTT